MNIFEEIFSDPQYDQLNNLVRWNGLNRNNNESVAHHSFIVAWFSRLIVEELLPIGFEAFKLEVTTYAIFHDFDEMFSGDITHDVKYNDFNGAEIKRMIDDFCTHSTKQKYDGSTPSSRILRENLLGEIEPSVKSIVKLADWLSMAYYVKKEINLGNKDLFEQYDYCSVQIRNNCTKCFMLMTKEFDGVFNSKVINEISNLKFSKHGR
jgi:5'-deoxynucleotidase YfbR-like HD superfamily hydrolase